MTNRTQASAQRRNLILSAAVCVFGKYGFRKVSVDELAAAARISKQGFYLYFPSKQAAFVEAMRKYLADGLELAQAELDQPATPLQERLGGAMNAWFGRHYATFSQESFDIIEAGDALAGKEIEQYKALFQAKLAKAIAASSEYHRQANCCSAKEIAQVLFICGLTWKEGHASREDFMKSMGLCIRACCQLGK